MSRLRGAHVGRKGDASGRMYNGYNGRNNGCIDSRVPATTLYLRWTVFFGLITSANAGEKDEKQKIYRSIRIVTQTEDVVRSSESLL